MQQLGIRHHHLEDICCLALDLTLTTDIAEWEVHFCYIKGMQKKYNRFLGALGLLHLAT